MLRQAVRTKGRQRQVSVTQSVPAPIGGWNAKDPLAEMPVNDAVTLENWFPTTIDCVIRGGTSAYATGITGTPETLAVHTAMTGGESLFAVTTTDAYDASVVGAATAQSLTITNAKFQWLNMGDSTNNWLLMFNGVDSPKYYNGTSWVEVTGATSPSLAGITPTSAISAVQYNGRLYMLEKNTLSFWYLPAGAVGGTAIEFDLSPFAQRGGYLMWAATWTYDGGNGLDDYIVFMTSEGEAIIYKGIDPSTAANWIKRGTYYVGKPLGRRSYIGFGGDLLAITQEGVFNMKDGLQYSRISERVALTDKIRDAFNQSARSYGGDFGWEAVLYPHRNAMIFNIPVGVNQEQYVLNTTTGAWCKFTGWKTNVFAIYNDNLYFSGDAVVTKAWAGASDLGANITADAKTSFTNFGMDSQSKRVNMFRPMLQANGAFSYLTDLEVDFNPSIISGVASFSPSSSASWGSALWGSGTWQGGLTTIRQWTSPNVDAGYYFAGKIKIETNTTQVHWISNDYVFEKGGVLS